MTTPAQKVANPEYLELQRVRVRIMREIPAMATALDRPARDLGSGAVWTGPAADEFAREVAGRKRRLAQLTEAVISAIDAKLHSTPRDCTPEEAATYRAYRRGAI